MKKSELHFEFPDELVAREPKRPSRICSSLNHFLPLQSESQGQGTSHFVEVKSEEAFSIESQELSWHHFLNLFQEGDVLVLNNTKVLKRRVFSSDGLEILFLNSIDPLTWEVLFPSKHLKLQSRIQLPGEVEVILIEKGRPQKVRSNIILDEVYFEKHGELPLPPYIQKAREERHTKSIDNLWYQTAWSEKPGSFAAPTASLHFNKEHLGYLKNRGIRICTLTLHVGLGTFLPVEAENLSEHKMHSEFVEIPKEVIVEIADAKQKNCKVWAMGTTVVRALESYGVGKFKFQSETNSFIGNTNLLILPGFHFQIVDRLLTNFHQPGSTLLALVMAFAGKEKVKSVYQWAIKNKFSLFSYGDLSVWERT